MAARQGQQKRNRSPRVVISVSVPADRYEFIGDAADAEGLSLSAFVADAALRAAERTAKREAAKAAA